jgi:hypothetical protein
MIAFQCKICKYFKIKSKFRILLRVWSFQNSFKHCSSTKPILSYNLQLQLWYSLVNLICFKNCILNGENSKQSEVQILACRYIPYIWKQDLICILSVLLYVYECWNLNQMILIKGNLNLCLHIHNKYIYFLNKVCSTSIKRALYIKSSWQL